MNYLLSILLFSYAFISLSQSKQFEFEDGMCSYSGHYNANQYTQVELKNTHENLLYSSYINTPSTAWKLEDIAELNLDSLNAECQTRLELLDSLDFVNSTFWDSVRKNRIQEISETCQLKALTIIAYSNPDTLLQFERADSLTNLFRNALIQGGDELLDAWRSLNEIQKAKNAFPERVQQRFEEHYNSPLKMEYAQLAVIQFGWWNHANHLIYHDPQTDYWSEFKKLFIRLESDCD